MNIQRYMTNVLICLCFTLASCSHTPPENHQVKKEPIQKSGQPVIVTKQILYQNGFTADATGSALVETYSAKLIYDYELKLLQLAIDLGELVGTLTINWNSGYEGTYLQVGDKVFKHELPTTTMPPTNELSRTSTEELERLARQQNKLLGLAFKDDKPYLVISVPPQLYIVELTNIQPLSNHTLDPTFVQHQNTKTIIDQSSFLKGSSLSNDSANKQDHWIETNKPWRFRSGNIAISYVPPLFRSTKKQYQEKRQECVNDSSCREWVSFFSTKYGWHCGPGHGGNTNKLDPVDSICHYHDNEKWGSGYREGWCGVAAAFACGAESGDYVWRDHFAEPAWALNLINTWASINCLETNYVICD